MPKPLIHPPIIVLGLSLLMVMTWYLTPQLRLDFELRVPLALALFLNGLGVLVWAALDFAKARTTKNPMQPELATALVISGPFQYSRNPMYLGMVLGLSGLMVGLGSPLNLIWLIGFVTYINRNQIAPEEKALTIKFGEAYTDYCKRVRRWF